MRNHLRVAIALALLLPRAGAAQQGAIWRDSAQRLGVIVHALRDSMLKGDSSVTEVARRGDLVIAASAGQRAGARAALDTFMKVRDRWFGDGLPANAGFRITLRIQSDERNTAAQTIRDNGTIILAGLPDTDGSVRVERTVWASAGVANLIDRYGEIMIASVTPLAKWIEHPPPLSMDSRQRRDLAMYSFVTGMGPMQRRCVGGDLHACQYALDIEHAPDSGMGAAFPKFIHADFLYFTLDAGGPGAWQRLSDAAHDSLGPRLAAAAAMPIDSLIARWRASLLGLRPASSAVTASSAIVAAAWITVLLLGALGASKWA